MGSGYQLGVLKSVDKHSELKAMVKAVFDRHQGRYGYRRITAAIHQLGKRVNHKTVERPMGDLKLKSLVRSKKYKSFKGEVGQVAPNELNRQFEAKAPNEKWATDVTEFNVAGEKLYLSPVLDLYNGESVAFEMNRRPPFELVTSMLTKAFARLGPTDKPMLHSDQGWQGRFNWSSQHLKSRRCLWDHQWGGCTS